MHKLLIFISFMLLSVSAFSGQKAWRDLDSGKLYTVTTQLTFSDGQSSFKVDPQTTLILKERVSLGMIKVELFKFDVGQGCPSSDMTTEIQLIDITQADGTVKTVGYDLAQDCTLEIFVELVDIDSQSIFKK